MPRYKNGVEKTVYRKIEILGRTAYVSRETIELIHALMAGIGGVEKYFEDLPPETWFLSIQWMQKSHKKWGAPVKHGTAYARGRYPCGKLTPPAEKRWLPPAAVPLNESSLK